MTELRQREWIVTFQAEQWDPCETETVLLAPRLWDVESILRETYPRGVIKGIEVVLDDWPTEEELMTVTEGDEL